MTMKTTRYKDPTEALVDPDSALRQDYDEYKRLFFKSSELGACGSHDDLLQPLMEVLRAVVGFSAFALLRRAPGRDDFDLLEEHNLDKKRHKRVRRMDSSGHLNWVCETNTVSPDRDEAGRDKNEPVVIVPLCLQDKVVGALILFVTVDPAGITLQQGDLLHMLGCQLASAIENLRIRDAMAVKTQVISSIRVFLEGAIASIADGLIAVAHDGKISLFNAAMEAMTGVSKTEAIGSRYQEVFEAEFTAVLASLYRQTQVSGSAREECELDISGKSLHLEMRASALTDEDGCSIGLIVACNDVSERQELIHLKQLDGLKDEFLSTVSHELRTPLTAIKAFAEILHDFESHDARTRSEFLRIINKETDRLIVLIEDLLDINHLTLGQFQIDSQVVDIEAVFADAMQSLGIVAAGKSIEVSADFEKSHTLVVGDHKRLVQVFVNIIGNAIKFSAARTRIQVCSGKISGQSEDRPHDYLRIAIADEGPGIPAAARSLVFERFKQIRPDRATKPDGSGLGLWISKQIVERLGGSIWIEDAPDKGSVFCFTLPTAG